MSRITTRELGNLATASREELLAIIETQLNQQHRSLYQLKPEQEAILFYLNHDLAQCKSKTNIALEIQKLSLLHLQASQKYQYANEKKVKLITIVFTNNSLLEGKAWKNRTAAKFKGTNIVVQRLASDTKKGKKGKKVDDFSKGTELLATFSTFAGLKNNGDRVLGDILIMCNHPTRINDMIEVIKTHAGLQSATVEFRYNVYFDEFDEKKCSTNMVRFVREIYKEKLYNVIDEIHLISATPRPDTHQELINITPDAEKLWNAKYKIEGTIDRVKDYRTVLDQEYKDIEGPTNPVDYVKCINDTYPEIFKPGKIYFIPSHHYCSEHEKMANLKLFQDKGYWTLVLNGKHKEFRSPLGQRESVLNALKCGGELRDILRTWRLKHPTAGLVITGKMVLERGLTFLTDGFNFDYMIISKYFARDIEGLVQIVGRGQGNEKFVDEFKVVMPQSLYDAIKKYIEDSEEILDQNPEFYDQDMLKQIGKIDKYANINEHFEPTIQQLADWVKNNIKRKNNKPARVMLHKWLCKKKEIINGQEFIKHKFGGTKENPTEEKVWSEEEARQTRGGMTPYSRRVFPCYTDTTDASLSLIHI